MKPQSILLSYFLLGSAQALTLPEGSALSKKSAITWAPCNLNITYDPASGGKDGFDCAQLAVPLDYTGTKSSETIKLDLIRFKGTKKPSKGSILYNPGGPGGSGVETIAAVGQRFSKITGGHYDIIGFDPRGVGRTIPFHCEVSKEHKLSRREFNSLPEADRWNETIGEGWESSGVLAETCYKAHSAYGDFIGTTFVARDMLSIVDALGQGPRLNFWGTSYGTVLGQVFISMFPNRVGRMVLDGNLLLEHYLTSIWLSSSHDAEKAVSHLLDECAEAETDHCSLADYAGKDTKGKDLMAALKKLMDDLVDKPSVKVGNQTMSGNDVLYVLKSRIFPLLYDPGLFLRAIEVIQSALKGNWTNALQPSPDDSTGWNKGKSATIGVSCVDSTFRVEEPDDLYSMYRAHRTHGSFTDVAMDKIACAQWKFDGVEKFDTNTFQNVHTSSPVLIVNGIYDPITPETHAWEISSRLRKSRVLIHKGAGHGFTAHPSDCTDKAVAKYFTDGEMPDIGTTCEPNKSVFDYIQEKKEEASGA